MSEESPCFDPTCPCCKLLNRTKDELDNRDSYVVELQGRLTKEFERTCKLEKELQAALKRLAIVKHQRDRVANLKSTGQLEVLIEEQLRP
jgi:hypothetical protein